ncbi:MAG: hypothetical protein V4650_14665 [Pseudomonadota bacterium]
MIYVVSATRYTKAEFWDRCALGLSLQRLEHDDRWEPRIAFENRRGLPEVFNVQIAACKSEDILIFIHDDVWLDDSFFFDRVVDGLRHYDVIGVAGNRRRVDNQPGWGFVDTAYTWDNPNNFSGLIAHGEKPFGKLSVFGPVPADCELLDGVFLAANAADLKEHEIFFDPRFDFHFYDIDFCRTARMHGLLLGTWPVCLTHQSAGVFGEAWQQKYLAYIDKWKS